MPTAKRIRGGGRSRGLGCHTFGPTPEPRIYAHVLPDEGEDLGFLDFTASCSTSGAMTTGQAGALMKLRGRGGE